MSEIVFPSGVTWSQRYVQAPDFIPEGVDISDSSYFYSGSPAVIAYIKYNMVEGVTSNNMFSPSTSIRYTVGLDISRIKNADYMFYQCKYVGSILETMGTNFENVVTAQYMLSSTGNSASSRYHAIIPDINLPKCTNTQYMFSYAYVKKIGDINCPLTTNVGSMLSAQGSSLQSVGLVDVSSANTSSTGPFGYNTAPGLKHLGGFKNLKASWTSGGCSACPNLTVESLMNVINNVWDWTDYPDGKVTNPNGQTVSYGTTHKLVLGSTNLAKLTDEQKVIATNKGWTLS